MIGIAMPCPETGRERIVETQGWPVTATWGVAWRPGQSDWSVTHLPTGRSVYATRDTARAIVCARDLGALFDVWVGKPGVLPTFGPHAVQLGNIVARYAKEDDAPPTGPKPGRKSDRRVVYIATPWRTAPGHGRAARLDYVRRAVQDSLARGESPVAPHMLFHGLLDDDKADERAAGMDAGMAALWACERLAVYEDHDVTEGMEREIEAAREMGMPIDYRRIDGSVT